MTISKPILRWPLGLLLATACAQAQAPSAPLGWDQVAAMKLPVQDVSFRYGDSELQSGELRIPHGKGPFPVMVILHGGCWQNAYDYKYMTHLAAWFEQRGVATWTLEYRRQGDPGAGYPGTFADVAAGTDFLRTLAKTHDLLDLKRVYAAGHSAGGQLALFLASRDQLPEKSVLYREHPLPIRGVLALDAITDLASYREGPAGSCHAGVDQLLGGEPARFPRRYAEASPRQHLPLDVPQAFVQGAQDPIVELASVRAYVEAADLAGDRTKLIVLPNAGHFEAAVPMPQSEAALSEAWTFLLQAGK